MLKDEMGFMNDLEEKNIFECCNCLQAVMYRICKKSGMNPFLF